MNNKILAVFLALFLVSMSFSVLAVDDCRNQRHRLPLGSWCFGTDLNHDGAVDVVDLLTLVENFHFGEKGCNVVGDINRDGKVNMKDVKILSRFFGRENCAKLI